MCIRDSFWFAALDSYHRNDPGVATVKNPAEFFYLPTPNDPQIQLLGAQLGENDNQAYNDYLGVPNSAYAAAGLEQLDQLLGLAPRATAQWVGFARVDWQAAERHRFTCLLYTSAWNSNFFRLMWAANFLSLSGLALSILVAQTIMALWARGWFGLSGLPASSEKGSDPLSTALLVKLASSWLITLKSSTGSGRPDASDTSTR